MNIAIVASMDKHRVIGHENKLPWYLPADLKYFKKVTMGKPIIMGRKTFESIGKALPGRQNIVITKNSNFASQNMSKDIEIAADLSSAIKLAHTEDEIMIIGGAEIFKIALPLTEKLYLTLIDHEFIGDTFFPAIDSREWELIHEETHCSDAKNEYPYAFLVYQRKMKIINQQ